MFYDINIKSTYFMDLISILQTQDTIISIKNNSLLMHTYLHGKPIYDLHKHALENAADSLLRH